VHFHSRVYIYTQDKHNDNIVSAVLGEGGSKAPVGAPPHQLGRLGERWKLPQRGPGRSPGDQQIFRILVCPERLSYATWGPWACVRPPRPGGAGVLPPALLG